MGASTFWLAVAQRATADLHTSNCRFFSRMVEVAAALLRSGFLQVQTWIFTLRLHLGLQE